MAKRKQSRSRRYGRRFKRKASKAKVPFEVLIAGGSIPFTDAASGISSPYDRAVNGDYVGVMDALKVGFLGFEPGRNTQTMNIMAALNPFDFEHARYSKMLLYAGLLGTVRKKLTGRYTNKLFAKIPLIGRWVS
jgi:hypothetical protein